VGLFFLYIRKRNFQILLNFNDYIFEQKLNSIFSNINENMNWLSDNEVEWDIIEEKIPKTNSKFWNIINSLDKKSKFLIRTLLNKSIKFLDKKTRLSKEQSNKLLNKILEKLDYFIKNTNLKKKLIYLSVFFIVSVTALSMMDITNDEIINTNITNDISKIDNKTTKEIIPNVNTKLNFKTTKEFLEKLAFKESTNIWDTVRYVKRKKDNKKIPAYVGKYQFGNIAFRDIKSKVRVADFAEDPSIWGEHQQDEDILKLMKNNKHYLRKKINFKGYQHYLGETINGVEITESGIMAAAHLIGNRGVKKFLKSGGENDPVDGNGTSCSKYMKIFSNYKLSI